MLVSAQELFSNQKEYTDVNWDDEVTPGGDKMYLVTFFVPWCHAAQALSPKMGPVVDDLRKRRYNINFGKVDVSKSP